MTKECIEHGVQETTIKELKQGEFFTLNPIAEPKEHQVWVRDEYNRSTKKYEAFRFSDIGDYKELKGDRKVYINFTF